MSMTVEEVREEIRQQEDPDYKPMGDLLLLLLDEHESFQNMRSFLCRTPAETVYEVRVELIDDLREKHLAVQRHLEEMK